MTPSVTQNWPNYCFTSEMKLTVNRLNFVFGTVVIALHSLMEKFLKIRKASALGFTHSEHKLKLTRIRSTL